MPTVLQYPRQAKLYVDRGFYPVSAMQYMADHKLSGRVLVTFNWAQYALASFAHTDPESRIAIDGRFRTCYPQPGIDMYFDIILEGITLNGSLSRRSYWSIRFIESPGLRISRPGTVGTRAASGSHCCDLINI